jgi:acyl CoA:acetate/3-ketoacid CoA transferase
VIQQALQSSLQGTNMKSRTFLHVSTTNSIIRGGGGTANTAFLTAAQTPGGGNANASSTQATFWIETIAGTGGNPDVHQLQYTQLVMLDFRGIHWPHVTVSTLRKQ